MHHMQAWPQKKVLDPLELVLKMVAYYYMDAGNQT